MCWWHPFRWRNRKLKNAWGNSFTSILRQHCSQKELPPSSGYFILCARDSMRAPALTMSTRWNGEGKWWKLLFQEKRLKLCPEPSLEKGGAQLDTGWPQLVTQSWAKPLKGEKRLWDQVLLRLSDHVSCLEIWGFFSFVKTEAIVIFPQRHLIWTKRSLISCGSPFIWQKSSLQVISIQIHQSMSPELGISSAALCHQWNPTVLSMDHTEWTMVSSSKALWEPPTSLSSGSDRQNIRTWFPAGTSLLLLPLSSWDISSPQKPSCGPYTHE